MSEKQILEAARAMIGKPKDACEYLGSILPFKLSNHQDYGIIFNIFIYSLIKSRGPEKNTLSDIEAILERELETNGYNYWYYEHLAHVSFHNNNPLSYLYYSKASSKSLGFSLFHLSHGVNTIIDFPD